jgi:hypothetical protein
VRAELNERIRQAVEDGHRLTWDFRDGEYVLLAVTGYSEHGRWRTRTVWSSSDGKRAKAMAMCELVEEAFGRDTYRDLKRVCPGLEAEEKERS